MKKFIATAGVLAALAFGGLGWSPPRLPPPDPDEEVSISQRHDAAPSASASAHHHPSARPRVLREITHG